MRLAERMGRLGTESAFEVLDRARALAAQGHDIIHLEIGEPDFDTPAHIVDAACKALHDGATHYTSPAGIPELRAAIAESMTQGRGLEVNPAQVVVTPGAKPIMFFTILALAEPGTEVIYPDPGFPIYRSMIEFVGAKPVPLPLREEREFRFDIDEFRELVTDRTSLIILNSPQNPTGGILHAQDLEAIAEICVERDIPVLSDEVYEHIIYDGEFASITAFPGMSTHERTIMLHGFSKTYAMTGWRLGYGIMPESLVPHIFRLMVNSNSCTNAATQFAGVAALQGPQDSVAAMVAQFERRREVIVKGLNELPGVSCVTPRGAFYAFPNITQTGMDANTCERFLLEKAGVACLSGAAFGQYGQGYLRLSYANSIENINRALERMDTALRSR
ncbi:MAG: pyridoxal phosphate-dependent aminotransferase [Anaerolineae bacterium]|nr:pyridoxal phosphate-dependent aminotransferase [Anaerolineae bacterium]